MTARPKPSFVMMRNDAPCEFYGHNPGDEFRVKTDESGEPVDRRYRNRLRDGDFKIIPTPKAPTKAKASTGAKE